MQPVSSVLLNVFCLVCFGGNVIAAVSRVQRTFCAFVETFIKKISSSRLKKCLYIVMMYWWCLESVYAAHRNRNDVDGLANLTVQEKRLFSGCSAAETPVSPMSDGGRCCFQYHVSLILLVISDVLGGFNFSLQSRTVLGRAQTTLISLTHLFTHATATCVSFFSYNGDLS